MLGMRCSCVRVWAGQMALAWASTRVWVDSSARNPGASFDLVDAVDVPKAHASERRVCFGGGCGREQVLSSRAVFLLGRSLQLMFMVGSACVSCVVPWLSEMSDSMSVGVLVALRRMPGFIHCQLVT